MRYELPALVVSRVGTTDAARSFVLGFSGLVNDLAKKWRLELGSPFADLSHSWVAPAKQLGAGGAERDVVLKLGVPGAELDGQVAALIEFRGQGCVQLLEADAVRGALLLERIRPGEPLSRLDDDDRATATALELLTLLWRPAPPSHPFRSVASWCKGLLEDDVGGHGPERQAIPQKLVERARRLLRELLRESRPASLLHADFHHFNVLDAGAGRWCAIDPKGAVGDKGFDLGPLLRNLLLNTDDPRRRLTRRVARAATELGQGSEWALGWGFVHSVLSTLWLLEDHAPGLDEALASMQVIAEVLGAI